MTLNIYTTPEKKQRAINEQCPKTICHLLRIKLFYYHLVLHWCNCIQEFGKWQHEPMNANKFFRFLHDERNLCHFNLRLNALRWGRWCRRPSWSGCRPACGSRRCGPRARRSGSRGPCWCRPSGSSSSPTGREPTGRRRTATTWTLSAWTERREAAEDKLVTDRSQGKNNLYIWSDVWISKA